MSNSAVIESFRKLHESGCFVIPNPWDIGSARWLRGQGFKALATTSVGFAFTKGRADQDVPLEMMLAHIAEIVRAVPDLPVNADFENGYADAPEGVAANVALCVATGVAGLSIEDGTGRKDDPLYPFALSVERVKAARSSIDAGGSGVVLTARAECFLTGHQDPLNESLKRIEAYAKAGADALFVPGVKTREQISAVVAAAGGLPVNVVVAGDFGLSIDDFTALGVRRLSTGGALARAAWSAFMTATSTILQEGKFSGFAGNGPSAPLNPFFHQDLADRGEA